MTNSSEKEKIYVDFAFDDKCTVQKESSSGDVYKDHICSIVKKCDKQEGCETVLSIDATDWSDMYPKLPIYRADDLNTDIFDDDIRPTFFDKNSNKY